MFQKCLSKRLVADLPLVTPGLELRRRDMFPSDGIFCDKLLHEKHVVASGKLLLEMSWHMRVIALNRLPDSFFGRM